VHRALRLWNYMIGGQKLAFEAKLCISRRS
jgi:hypothetical protein